METVISIKNWTEITHKLGVEFSKRTFESDTNGTFVYENYAQLKEQEYFSAMIPEEFGGGNLQYKDMCNTIRTMAHYCGSTALAFSMHQHLIAATIWKYKHKNQGAPLLQKVVADQIVLVSTGARDWLESNGELKKVKGGFEFTGKKSFASQSADEDIAVTSATYLNENNDWKVLHFGVPIKTEGVSVINDWDVMGMRGTGSQSIVFDKVFVPETAISLERPRSEFHIVWDIVITVALPLIMSAYVGIAERAMEIAVEKGKKYFRNQNHITHIIGKMNNTLVSARTQWKAMYALTNNFDFKPDESITNEMLSLKTNVADACIQTVSEAMEAIGGQSFYKKNELERLFRDVQAAQFHPLPKWEQYDFVGKRILNK
ncbi:acyl-CoA dehydrogenase family protein [Chondrinema litorale]|uniref:acyl-CoA dehydrogenase family protein n=1 Tax=Chondrinema litorale TaxID=2994555 RepID=UPI002542E318|nr:acyl-CoA dehydrogenase family protein [Chondrinema litorale]UZR98040.1 acyl-CoA/acyl-ACP dehydrogenase [Chondrinema litorale]